MTEQQKREVRPYGLWDSPVGTAQVVEKRLGLGEVAVDGDRWVWSELRPEEGGRAALVAREANGSTRELLPAPWNARTRVHEYGGGSFVVRGGVLVFSNFRDQKLYLLDLNQEGAQPRALTADGLRFADGVLDLERRQWVGIREDHREDGEPINTVCAVSLDKDEQEGSVLAQGADFYAAARLSPCGSKLVWIEWDHPNMPWDTTRLMHASWDGEVVSDAVCIAGGEEESVAEVRWSAKGDVLFASDRTGWWNLYRRDAHGETHAIWSAECEFSRAPWVFGMSSWDVLDEEHIIATRWDLGVAKMAVVQIYTGETREVPVSSSWLRQIRATSPTSFLAVAASATESIALVEVDTASGESVLVKASGVQFLGEEYMSVPETIQFTNQRGEPVHAFFYPPTNPDFQAPEGTKPPLIVWSHGGPTSCAYAMLRISTQFWTSRGFAVVDVNYSGSSGYGRAYRNRLLGEWGLVDVEDCAAAALNLAEKGRVDRKQLAISGGSAGGYTTLCALTFTDVFSAGASHYGISDLEALVRDTHKFESRYPERLVGPWPEAKAVYVARSPIHFVDQISCPVIVLQGGKDRVVPPNQAEMIVDALKKRGLPVEYVFFEEEAHGFRDAKNIQKALSSELEFYQRVFGLDDGFGTE